MYSVHVTKNKMWRFLNDIHEYAVTIEWPIGLTIGLLAPFNATIIVVVGLQLAHESRLFFSTAF